MAISIPASLDALFGLKPVTAQLSVRSIDTGTEDTTVYGLYESEYREWHLGQDERRVATGWIHVAGFFQPPEDPDTHILPDPLTLESYITLQRRRSQVPISATFEAVHIAEDGTTELGTSSHTLTLAASEEDGSTEIHIGIPAEGDIYLRKTTVTIPWIA